MHAKHMYSERVDGLEFSGANSTSAVIHFSGDKDEIHNALQWSLQYM